MEAIGVLVSIVLGAFLVMLRIIFMRRMLDEEQLAYEKELGLLPLAERQLQVYKDLMSAWSLETFRVMLTSILATAVVYGYVFHGQVIEPAMLLSLKIILICTLLFFGEVPWYGSRWGTHAQRAKHYGVFPKDNATPRLVDLGFTLIIVACFLILFEELHRWWLPYIYFVMAAIIIFKLFRVTSRKVPEEPPSS